MLSACVDRDLPTAAPYAPGGPPSLLLVPASYSQLSAGVVHTCAIKQSGGTLACWGNNWDGQTNVPSIPSVRVNPTATFSAPTSVVARQSFTLALTGAQVPGYSGTVTFSYAFDCGDGSGYGTFGTSNTASCPTSAAGSRTVKGRVQDHEGGQTEYTGTVQVTAPVVLVEPASLLAFGDVSTGSSEAQLVTLANTGDAPLSVSGLTLLSGTPFSITSAPALPATLEPGQTVDVQVSFAPTTTGGFSNVLRITSNDLAQPQVEVSLTGTGVTSAPPPGNGVEQVLDSFDAAVLAGTLQGECSGASGRTG